MVRTRGRREVQTWLVDLLVVVLFPSEPNNNELRRNCPVMPVFRDRSKITRAGQAKQEEGPIRAFIAKGYHFGSGLLKMPGDIA